MIVQVGLPARYHVQSRIGAGGFGSVYRAHDKLLDRIVAVKVLEEVAEAARDSLADEFRILSSLSHPCLVKVLDFGLCESGTPFFSMEYIDGPDLKKYLADPSVLVSIDKLLTDILSAMHYLGTRGIVHGDIKPENILIHNIPIPRPVLADFGLAAIGSAQAETLSGTPRFLAPEVITERRHSVRSDLYALGHTLIESITRCETPLAPKVDAEYLEGSNNFLEERFRLAEVKHPADLASIITSLAHPSEEQRTNTPTSALQRLRVLDLAEDPASLFSEEAHIERAFEEASIRDFIISNTNIRVLLLEGIGGCGKKCLIRRAAGTGQLKGYLVLNTLSGQRLSIDVFIEIIASNLSGTISAELLSRHRDIVSRLVTAKKQEDLINVNVIHDNIAKTLHDLSQERPILILIADLERHDEDLVYMVGQLVHESALYASNIKFIISRNIDTELAPDRASRQEKILNELDARKMEIRGFDYEQYVQFFQTLFQDPVFSPEEHKKLFEWTRGIPQVIVDHLKYLVGTGIITFHGNTYHIDLGRYSVGVIDSRDRYGSKALLWDLEPGELYPLNLLALYDLPISVTDLECLLGSNPVEFIDKYRSRGILETEEGMIRLASPTYSVLFANKLAENDRKSMHKQIADYLSAHKEDAQTDAARHYIKAGAINQAYEHVISSIDQLKNKHQYYTCNALLKDLFRLLRDSGELLAMLDIQERLCESNVALGVVDEALNDYKLILSSSKDPMQQARSEFSIGHLYATIVGNKAAAREHYLKALSLLQKTPSRSLEAKAHLYLGTLDNNNDHLRKAADLSRDEDLLTYISSLSLISTCSLRSGDIEIALKIDDELEKFMDTSDLSILKDIFDAKSIIYFYTGKYAEAEEFLKKAIAIAETTSNQIEIVRFSSHLSGLHYVRGDYFEQINRLSGIYFLAKRFKAYAFIINILSNLSLGHICLALYRNAIDYIEEGNSHINENSVTRIPYYFCSVASHAYCQVGADYKNEYSRWIKELEHIVNMSDIKVGSGNANANRGTKSFLSLDFNTALSHYREAAAIYESANIRDDHVEALLRFAECLLELGDREEAAQQFKKAEEIFEAIGCLYLAPLYWYVRGRLEASAEAGSAGSLQTALNISTKQGTREMTWQIQRALAEYHLRSGSLHEASNHYRAAVETLKQITESFQDEKMVRSYLNVPLRRRLFDEIHALKERL